MRALALLVLLLCPALSRAAEPVDLTLVLVSDLSRSVDDSEFKMEKEAYGSAFTDPRVIAAIKGGPVGAIAVAYIEFAGSYGVRTVLDWRVIRDADSAKAFGDALTAAPRSFWGAPASAPAWIGRCRCWRKARSSRSAR